MNTSSPAGLASFHLVPPSAPAKLAAQHHWQPSLAVGLTALVAACALLFSYLSPGRSTHPTLAVAAVRSARISGHFKDADVKTIFGSIATQIQAKLVVDPSLTRKIDTFDIDGERLQDVMNDLCTISACDWAVEAGNPATLTVREKGK